MASEGKKVPFLLEKDKDFPNLWREGEFRKSSGELRQHSLVLQNIAR